MKALLLFGYPLGVGGHFKSSLSLFREFNSKDNKYYLLTFKDSNQEMIKEFKQFCVKVYTVDRVGYSKYLMRSLITNKLKEICINDKIDYIFSQDFIAMVASLETSISCRIPLFYTQAGGAVSRAFPPKELPTIVFSEELKDGLQKKYRLLENNVAIIKERIDCSIYKPLERIDSQVLKKYNVPLNNKFKIFMAVRFAEQKMGYIKAIFQIIKKHHLFFMDINLIIAGDGPMKEETLSMILNTNKELGVPVVYYIGKVISPLHIVNIYNYADIVIGSGRGIIEPMACGTNVILTADVNKAVEINRHNFPTIKYWNFSIRALDKLNNTFDLFSLLKKFKYSKPKINNNNRQLIYDNYNIDIGVVKLSKFVSLHKNSRLSYISVFRWYFKYKALYNIYRLRNLFFRYIVNNIRI